MKTKEIKNMTYEELVKWFALEIHSALLHGGGKEMETQIYLCLNTILREWKK